MPVQSCSDGDKPGFKWGDSGKCYTYAPSNEKSKGQAKRRAYLQGIAIGEYPIKKELLEDSIQYFIDDYSMRPLFLRGKKSILDDLRYLLNKTKFALKN